MTSKRKNFTRLYAPISLGELIDKITILEIKKKHMTGIKKQNVNTELELLKGILKDNNLNIEINLINHLREINNSLWEIEDKIRIKERNQSFDKDFIQLARSVYKKNDKRSTIKKEINQKYNSDLIEEKSYD